MLTVKKKKRMGYGPSFYGALPPLRLYHIALEDRMRYNIKSRKDYRSFGPAAVLRAVFYKGGNYALAKHNV